MRLLYAGHDYGRGVAVAADTEPKRSRNYRRDERAHLPVRHVSEDCQRDSRGVEERSPGMISRRDFFGKLGGGGIVVVMLADDSGAQETGGGARRGTTEPVPQQISAWLHIGEDGVVSVFTGKVEVGQNARTSLTQAVAEELHAPPVGIRMVMGDTALTPWDLGTVGSMTTPRMAPQVRKAAAAAREMLIDVAAQKWKVDRASVSIAAGKVYSGSHSANFAELTHGEKLARTIPGTLEMTPATEWKVAG